MDKEHCWTLSISNIELLTNEERIETSYGGCPKIYSDLSRRLLTGQQNACRGSLLPLALDSGFEDYPVPLRLDEDKNKPLSQDAKISPTTKASINFASEFLEKLLNGNTNAREIIELVSIVPGKNLEEDLLEVWKNLKDVNFRENFIDYLSNHPASAQIICQKILLTELLREEKFHPTLKIILPHVQAYESCIISELLIPLLKTKPHFILEDTAWLKEIVAYLSQTQKSTLLSGFIVIMEEEEDIKNHLQILSILLEDIPLSEILIKKLIAYFGRHISSLNEERAFGKILLLVSEACRTGTSKNVVRELSNVCGGYKGMMRFRINANLKKLL